MTVGLLSFVQQVVASLFWTPGQRPFAASSPGNTPLAANQILVPAPWPAPSGGIYYIVNKFLFDQAQSGAPSVVTASLANWHHPAGNLPARLMTSGANSQQPDNTGDHEFVSINGNDAESYWLFERTSDTAATCNAYGNADLVLDSGFGDIWAQTNAGVFATGQSCMMGTLIKEEFTAGEIDHIVNLVLIGNLYCNSSYPYWPALQNDAGATNGFCVEGQLMSYPPGMTMPAGLSVYGQKIFRAIQNYGAFICDTGGSNSFYAATSYNNPSGSWTETDLYGSPLFSAPSLWADAQILMPLLQKVGYPLDGIFQVMSPYETFDPQLQLLQYAGPQDSPYQYKYNDAGAKLMNVTRDSGGAALDIGMTAAPQSLLDTAEITAYGAGTTVRVSTYYGQFGVKNLTSVGSQAPAIYASGALKTTANGTPAMYFDGTGANIMQMTGSSAAYPNGSVYLFAKGVQLADYAATYTLVSGDAAGCLELVSDITTGLIRLRKNGGATIALTSYQIPINAPVNISAFYNSDGSYSISLNGVILVQGTGTLVSVTAANIRIGAGPSGANPLKGLIVGGLICSNVGLNAWPNPKWMIEQYNNNFLGPMGTVLVNTTTLNATIGTPQLAYYNGNLTVADTYVGGAIALGTVGKSSGSYYNEVLVNTENGVSAIGISNAAQTSTALYYSNGAVQVNGITVATLPTWATGNIVRMAVTLGSIIEFAVDGATLTSESISGLTSGPYFPALVPAAFGSTLTANFGATAWEDISKVPAGFSNWA